MDIVSLPTELTGKDIDSRYRLVIIAAQRAKRLAEGSRATGPTHSVKPTTIAVEEALEGNLDVLTGDEAREARQEAKKVEARRRAAEAERREEMGMELSELEKDLKYYLNEKEEKERKAIEDLFVSSDDAETEGSPAEE